MKKIKYLFYAIGYLFKTKILRQEIPFIGGLVINEKCNLHCKQCDVANRNIPDLSYENIEKGLQTFFSLTLKTILCWLLLFDLYFYIDSA